MTKLDALGITVFSMLALGLLAVRMWGTAVLGETDGMLLVFCAAAGWVGFAALFVDRGPPGEPRGRASTR